MKFEVNTSSLSYTIQKMNEELSNITGIAKNLYAALTALEGMWEGASHDIFAAQYQNDQQTLENMTKTLSNVIKGLDEARKVYEQCEDSVETEIRKIAV